MIGPFFFTGGLQFIKLQDILLLEAISKVFRTFEITSLYKTSVGELKGLRKLFLSCLPQHFLLYLISGILRGIMPPELQ